MILCIWICTGTTLRVRFVHPPPRYYKVYGDVAPAVGGDGAVWFSGGRWTSSELIALGEGGQVEGTVVELFPGLVPGQNGSSCERVWLAGPAHGGHFHHLPLGRFPLPVVGVCIGPGVPGGSGGGSHRMLPEQGRPTLIPGHTVVFFDLVFAPVQQVDAERLVGNGCWRVKVVQAAVEQRKLRREWRLLLRWATGSWHWKLRHPLSVDERSAVRQVRWPRGLWGSRKCGRCIGLGLVHWLVVPVMEVVHVVVLMVVVCLARSQRRFVQRDQSQFSRVSRVVDGQCLFQVLPAADGYSAALDLLAGHLWKNNRKKLFQNPQLIGAKISLQ